MKILFFDGTSNFFKIFISENNIVLDEFNSDKSGNHAEMIIYQIEQILNKNNLVYDDLDIFANIRGPGSFTGERISSSILITFSNLFPLKKFISLTGFDIISNSYKNNCIYLIVGNENNFYVQKNGENMFFNSIQDLNLWLINNNDRIIIHLDDKKILNLINEKINNFTLFDYRENHWIIDSIIQNINNESCKSLRPIYIKEFIIKKSDT